MQDFGKRPKHWLALRICFLDAGLDNHVDMVWHHAGSDEAVPALAPVEDAIEDDVARGWRQLPSGQGLEIDDVDGPRLLEVGEVAFGVDRPRGAGQVAR